MRLRGLRGWGGVRFIGEAPMPRAWGRGGGKVRLRGLRDWEGVRFIGEAPMPRAGGMLFLASEDLALGPKPSACRVCGPREEGMNSFILFLPRCGLRWVGGS